MGSTIMLEVGVVCCRQREILALVLLSGAIDRQGYCSEESISCLTVDEPEGLSLGDDPLKTLSTNSFSKELLRAFLSPSAHSSTFNVTREVWASFSLQSNVCLRLAQEHRGFIPANLPHVISNRTQWHTLPN